MSGWSDTGFRVELGSDEAWEYRDFVSYWGDKVEVAPGVFEYQYKVSGVTKMKRLIIIERAVWRGLTKTGAETKEATAGWRITGRDRVGESGQWHVTEELKTEGAWENA